MILQKIADKAQGPNYIPLLSVKDHKTFKTCIARLVRQGIYTKLQPNLPFHVNQTYKKTDDIFYQYKVLIYTVGSFYGFIKNNYLRYFVLSEALRAMLIGLYQIAYCPLKKNFDEKFTEEIYQRLLREKQTSVVMLKKLRERIHPEIYIKETMLIFQQNSPQWFKTPISLTLTNILLSCGGVERIALVILDGTSNDKTQTWRALDVIFRLISYCKTQLDFRENTCQQLVKLIDKTDDDSLIFERLFVICTKNFYVEDKELSNDVFVRRVVIDLLRFTFKDYTFQEDYTERIKQSIRLVHAIFVEKTAESRSLPVEILKPILEVIFRIYSLTRDSVLKSTHSEAKEILIKYMNDCPQDDNIIFDSFLFGISNNQNILGFRKDLTLEIQGQSIFIKPEEHAILISVAENSERLLTLLENNSKLLTRFFTYLLRCLVHREKYFTKSNPGLLELETDIMNEYFERSLVVFNVLSILAEDKKIQNEIIDSPDDIISFVKNVLERTIATNVHKSTEFECNGFQTMFTVTMILNALIGNYSKKNLRMFKVLVEPLEIIKNATKHKELVDLIEAILSNIEVSDKTKMHIEESKSELDVILEDICDPLLPVRGHGLMALRKLVEKNDAAVMQKKQYILTIFQVRKLKHYDFFLSHGFPFAAKFKKR